MALTDNLVSYWKLDESSGNALDAHGANELTDTNTVGTATGKINTARDFESGSTEYFTINDNTDLSIGNEDHTFTGWFNIESAGTSTILGKGGTGEEYALRTIGGNLYYTLRGSVSAVASTFGSLSTATWYFFEAWYDSTNDLIGVGVNRTANTASYTLGSQDLGNVFRIGAYGTFGQYWDGLIDEVGFWKRLLTSDELDELYAAGAGLAYPFSAGGGHPAMRRQMFPGQRSRPIEIGRSGGLVV